MSAVASRRLSGPQAVGAALGAALAFQLGVAISIDLFPMVGPIGAMFLRQLISVIVLAVIVRPRWSRLDRDGRRAVLALGAVVAAMNTAFYLAIDRIPIGVALAIEISGPLVLAAAGARRRSDLGFIALAACGAATLSLAHGTDGPIAMSGVALAAASGVCWATYMVVAGRVSRGVRGIDGLVWALATTALLLAPVAIRSAGTALLQPHVLLLGVVLGLVGSALPYTLEMVALKTIRPAVLGLLVSAAPVIGALAGLILQGQRLASLQIAGIALIVVAAAGVFRRGVPG